MIKFIYDSPMPNHESEDFPDLNCGVHMEMDIMPDANLDTMCATFCRFLKMVSFPDSTVNKIDEAWSEVLAEHRSSYM